MDATPIEQVCTNCAFWRSSGSDLGSCRRYPPRLLTPEGSLGHWPVTQHDDWCGEFQARSEVGSLVRPEEVEQFDALIRRWQARLPRSSTTVPGADRPDGCREA
jgi:hypothetical protein